MSKKHYIMLAKALKSNNAGFALCADMAVQLQMDNPLFDIERFMTACGH